jgi:hypothetical protein
LAGEGCATAGRPGQPIPANLPIWINSFEEDVPTIASHAPIAYWNLRHDRR